MFSLQQAAAWVGGPLQGGSAEVTEVVIDSRRVRPGALFVALRGDRCDGHDFLPQAQGAGAVGALVERLIPSPLPQILVEDCRRGLGRLAASWRGQLPGKLIALTGSNGKTTCKALITAILAQVGPVRATEGNLNNDVGMPLSLLGMKDEEHLVLELGANHRGEIAYLTEIARPALGLITNAGRAHLEGFGSPEGVASAKGELAASLPEGATLVIPADSPWSPLWRGLAGDRPLVTFGLSADATVRADPAAVASVWDAAGFRTEFLGETPWGRIPLGLGLLGLHNVRNALAAVAVAGTLGVNPAAIERGLAAVRPVSGRLQPRLGRGGVRLIDDSYNANPESVGAAIEVLAGLPGRRWLVLGDLAELGPTAKELHEAIGLRAREVGLDRLAGVGRLSALAAGAFGPGGLSFPDREALLAGLAAGLDAGDLVLVKGSRSAGMDRVVEALAAEAGG